LDEQLPVLLTGFAQAYVDVESVTHRASCLEVFELREYEEQGGAQGLLERLYEVMSVDVQLDVAGFAAQPTLPAITSAAAETVHQIKVMLRGSRPPVWRRLQVASSTTLTGLHEVIQAAFGWDDDHLWVFNTDYGQFGPSPDLDDQDPHRAALAQIAGEGAKFGYLFDFGDHWDHEITVEKVLPAGKDNLYPVCVGGRQPDPVQYRFDDDDEAGEVFDKNIINVRLEVLRTRA
jgi:hypothetical protein